MVNRPRFLSLISAFRKWSSPVSRDMVEVLELILGSLPPGDRITLQLSTGGVAKTYCLCLLEDGRLELSMPGTVGTLYFGGNNAIEHSSGAKLTPGGSWANASAREIKRIASPVSKRSLLARILALPLHRWQYEIEGRNAEFHLGPMAAEFHAAFRLGDAKSIVAGDVAAIALAGIQELAERLSVIEQHLGITPPPVDLEANPRQR